MLNYYWLNIYELKILAKQTYSNWKVSVLFTKGMVPPTLPYPVLNNDFLLQW